MTTASIKSLSLEIADHKRRLLRFGLIGASGVLVNSTLLYLLTEASSLNHLVAAALATEATILYNFSLNDRWAFRDAKSDIPWAQRALRYNCVALGGLMISIAVLALLTHFLSLNYLFANLFAIGAATLWNYAVNSCFTWSTAPASSLSVGSLTGPSSAKELAPRRVWRQACKGRDHRVSQKRTFSPGAPAAYRSRSTLATEAAQKRILSRRKLRAYPRLSKVLPQRSYERTTIAVAVSPASGHYPRRESIRSSLAESI